MDQLKSLEDLIELMDLDLQIDKLLDRRNSLPQLSEYKSAHEEVERLTSARQDAQSAFQEADRGLEETNRDLEIAVEKAASEQNRLYAGGLSARDADYLRREVEMLYAKVSKMEDQVLEFIEATELAEADTERLAHELTHASEGREQRGSEITERWPGIDKERAVEEDRKTHAISRSHESRLENTDERTGRAGGGAYCRPCRA